MSSTCFETEVPSSGGWLYVQVGISKIDYTVRNYTLPVHTTVLLKKGPRL